MTTEVLTDELYQELVDDLELFASTALTIKHENGGSTWFELNNEQRYIHKRLEEQKAKTGRVRAIILKGRQQGCSTYVAARFYHQAIHKPECAVFILAHLQDSTDVLFDMVRKFQENIPKEIKPKVSTDNAKQLVFNDIGSSYKVGASGSGEKGRGSHIDLLHMSEAAFYENTDKLKSGLMQAVHDVDDSEIIIESTANGIGNMFHRMAMNALNEIGEYQLIFIPWFWHEEYRRTVPDNFILNEEEHQYKRLYELTDEQMAWRRNKVLDMGEWKFKQEYPSTVAEAFEVSGEGSFIPTELVARARRTPKPKQTNAPLVIGVDPAGEGKDSIGICFRQGRIVEKCYELKKNYSLENITMQIVQHVAEIIDTYNPNRVFIDKIGVGTGVCDRLQELGYGRVITRVNASERCPTDSAYYNKRAEMWGNLKDWLKDEPVCLPDDDSLHGELVGFQWAHTSNNQIQLESKQSKRRLEMRLKSPGMGDALALTFAYPMAAVRLPTDRYRLNAQEPYMPKPQSNHWVAL